MRELSKDLARDEADAAAGGSGEGDDLWHHHTITQAHGHTDRVKERDTQARTDKLVCEYAPTCALGT